MTNTLSILMPVYNEQAYLARIVERVPAAPVPGDLRKEAGQVPTEPKIREKFSGFHKNHFFTATYWFSISQSIG